ARRCARISACRVRTTGSSQQPQKPPSSLRLCNAAFDNAAMKIFRALLVILALLPAAAWAQPSATGVVLMHGKWGTPDKGIQPVELELKGAGFLVVSQEMPWSDRRALDPGFREAVGRSDTHGAQLPPPPAPHNLA